MKRHGSEGKLYRNTASYASPVWSEIEAKDVTLPLKRILSDASTRGRGTEEFLPGLKHREFTFNMPWNPEDADFAALLDAVHAGSGVELAVMDRAIASDGAEGVRGTYLLTVERHESLGETMMANFEAKPDARATNAPERVSVSAS